MKVSHLNDRTCVIIEQEFAPVTDKLGGIIGLNSDDTSLSVGSILVLHAANAAKKEIMRIGEIKKLPHGKWKVSHQARLASYHILLPTLFDDSVLMKQRMGVDRIISTVYIDHRDHIIPFAFYVLVRNDQNLEFLSYHEALESHPQYRGKENVDRYYDLLIFETPEKYKEDFSLLYNGQYSKLSNRIKVLTIKFCPTALSKDRMSMRFNQDPALRKSISEIIGGDLPEDAELGPIPSETEVYDREIVAINLPNDDPVSVEEAF
jgi:hypothetical protein